MQLFTHLLSSYLQGMEDFFSALPRGGSSYLLCLRVFDVAPSPWGRSGWGSYVGWYAPPATLTELLLMAISNISPISTSPKQRGIVLMR